MRKFYVVVLPVLGVLLMGFGQYMAKPDFYGTPFGRAWAHVFWCGAFLLMVPLTVAFARYIAHHKDPIVRAAGKFQLISMISITLVIGLIEVLSIIWVDPGTTEHALVHQRRGMFALGLLIIFLVTIGNLLVLLFRYVRRSFIHNRKSKGLH